MSELITIGYSTRNPNPEFTEYLKKSSGFKKINVIEKVNDGEKSLTQVYNEILKESNTDIVIFCHDDIYFNSTNWYNKIVKHFDETDFGIIGIAGTTFMPKSGQWWEDRSKMYGIVNHEHEGKKWESKYSDSLENRVKEVVVVDGLFFAINKKRIKSNFDEEFSGFHFYDISFCFSNFLQGVKVGVVTNIRVTHRSIGMTNEQWEINKTKFVQKFSFSLPQKIKLNKEEKSKILICFQDFTEKENHVLENLYTYLSNHDLSFLNLSLVDKFKKPKTYNPKNLPGFKMGDGKWGFNTTEGFKPSQPNVLYKTSEVNYDIIITIDVQTTNKLNTLYPNTNKIIFLTEKQDISSLEKENHKCFFVTNVEDLKYYEEGFDFIKNKLILFEKNFVDVLFEKINIDDEIEFRQKIKIVTGYSNRGGSTMAFINLTNQLNKIGYDCVLYGPHEWHLDKCKSNIVGNLTFEPEDILITHFIQLEGRPNVKKVIFSLHEKNIFEISKIKKFWDTVVFLNEEHKSYHKNYNGDYEIIPNLKPNLVKSNKDGLELVAGVIGSIDLNKQTHISIQRALNDGCEKIYVFGTINDENYFKTEVEKLLSDKVILHGFIEDKQKMYDMIGSVYQSSLSECASLVKDECELTNTKFFGNDSINHVVTDLPNEEIINKWIKLF